MRANNYFMYDYIRDLRKANVTPAMELQECLNIVKGKYDKLEAALHNLDTWYSTGVAPQIGRRKKLDRDRYAVEVECIPVHISERISGTRTPFEEPNLTAEQWDELKLLHWLYIEIQTLVHRVTYGGAYA